MSVMLSSRHIGCVRFCCHVNRTLTAVQQHQSTPCPQNLTPQRFSPVQAGHLGDFGFGHVKVQLHGPFRFLRMIREELWSLCCGHILKGLLT